MTVSEKLTPQDIYAILNRLGINPNGRKPDPNGWITIRSPLREDNNPSFGLNLHTGAFKDHGTDESGDVITLVEQLKDINTTEAIKWVKELLHYLPAHTSNSNSTSEAQKKRPDIFWDSQHLLLLSENQERLKREPDHPLIQQVLSYDQVKIDSLLYFGCGILNQYGEDWLAFPYDTGCQLYRRVDGQKQIRTLKGSTPGNSFFGGRKITRTCEPLVIGKSPREAMLLHQLLLTNADVIGLATGEQSSLSDMQVKWFRKQIEGSDYNRIILCLDCDTEEAYKTTKQLALNIKTIEPRFDVSIVNIHQYTKGKCKDVTDVVKDEEYWPLISDIFTSREPIVFEEQVEKPLKKLPEINLDIATAPSIPDIVYEHLPEFLQAQCQLISEQHRKDVFLVSALPVVAAHMPKVLADHSDGYYSPDLFTLVVAAPGTGKGTAGKAKKLGHVLNEHLIRDSKIRKADYEAMTDEQKSQVSEPREQSLFIPANSSSRAIYDTLDANGGSGLLFETEIDTMLNATGQDWGNFSDITRKAFHHESISINRKDENFSINKPRLSICLTGTFDQFTEMFQSAENGHFSRYALYTFNVPRIWQSHRPTAQSRQLVVSLEAASMELYELYSKLKPRAKPLYVDLTSEQWSMIDSTFSDKMQLIEDLDLSSYLHASNNRAAILALRMASMFVVLRTLRKNPVILETATSIQPGQSDMTAALWLADTFIKHAIRLYHILPKATDVNGKGERYRHFYLALPEEFETSRAIEIAEELNIPERTAHRWLSSLAGEYLTRIKRGYYKKMTE